MRDYQPVTERRKSPTRKLLDWMGERSVPRSPHLNPANDKAPLSSDSGGRTWLRSALVGGVLATTWLHTLGHILPLPFVGSCVG
jgi:hypothetical protein